MARRAGILILSLGIVCALAGCSTGPPAATPMPTTAAEPVDAGPLPNPPSPETVIVAEAVTALVEVFDRPDPSGRAPRTVTSPRASGTPTVFVVIQRRNEMAEVLLPIRPTGTSGWIRLSDVRLTQHQWRIVVELSAYRLTVFQAADVVRVETIGIGTAGTPTPDGRWFTTELLRPPQPDGPYGAYAFGLSGFTGASDGPASAFGQLGLHGTNDPTNLGRNVSLGCLRVSNEAITALATQLPLGVPVDIRA